MKSKTGGGGRGGARAALELKQRVIQSLNKLSDRDTHQIGAEELERMATDPCLAQQEGGGISAFLSCVTADAGSDQKASVRRESVRLLGTLARSHAPSLLLLPHLLAKMVASVVRRLRDPDSSVRDACVEATGALASSIFSPGTTTTTISGMGAEEAAAFVTIAKPLFEALVGEQNRYVQMGSALCLARVIDEANHAGPLSLLPQMLARVVKLLKNPHFMAKPAVIELVRSIVQAGGASSEHALSTAVTSILETLRSVDWTTRKAASGALAGIALCAGPLLGSFKTSCIRSLESCRFDKVKPVRDAVMHALQCWKALPATGSTDPSEAGSSTKENMNREYADATTTSDGGWRDTSCMKGGSFSAVSGYSISTSKKRNPSTLWKNCPNYVPNQNHQSTNDWHVEMSLPKVHSVSSGNNRLKEFAGSCTAMVFGREVDISKGEDAKYDYDGAEDNVECSSMSDLVSGCFETKHVTVDEGNSATLVGAGHKCATEDVDLECPRMQERKSLDSTVTDLNSHGVHECCLHAATELTSIRKQLLDIETKQSNLLDLLQAFMGNSEDKLSTLQLKVHNLEYAVDKIVKNISYSGNHSDMATSKFTKSNQSMTSSPRLSTSTPRPSVESNYRQSSLSTLNNNELWGINEFSRSRSSTSVKEGAELWRDPTLNIVRNCVRKKDTGRGFQSVARCRKEETRDVRLVSSRNTIAKQGKMEATSGFWKQIKEFLQCGDMESAYAEALYSGDELCLIELMNRTGPVLEKLPWELTGVIISILTTQFLDHKFMDSIIPWILQVVDLCTTCEPMQLAMSSKSRLEFLYAVQKLASMECIDTVDKIAVAEFAAKLSQLWGEAPSRKMPAARASEGNKTTVAATRV